MHLKCDYCHRRDETVDSIREFHMDESSDYQYTGRETAVCDQCFYNSSVVLRFHDTDQIEILFDEF